MKLSDTQRKVLERMAAGETLHFVSHMVDCYTHFDGETRLEWPMVWELERDGYIQRLSGGGDVILTDAGREAIGENE